MAQTSDLRPPSPARAFCREVRKGVTGGLFWGGIHAAVVGGFNAQVSWLLGLNFALLVLAVWLPITTTVGVARGVKQARLARAAGQRRAEPAAGADGAAR